MATMRTQWFLAAGILVSAATGPRALAGETVNGPVTPVTGIITFTQNTAPGKDNKEPVSDVANPATGKPRPAVSPYNTVPRAALWQADDKVPPTAAPDAQTQTIHLFKAVSPAVEARPVEPAPVPCVTTETNAMTGETHAKPSVWQRCRSNLQDCFLGYPGEFSAPPLGYFLYEHGKTQVVNGTAARMTLYHYDFEEGRNALTPRGRDQLAKIAALLPQNFFPVVIERTPEAPALAEARRRVVLAELARAPFPIPPERVMVGVPMANGISGVEAEKIYRNLISQTTLGGLSLPPIGIGGSQPSTGLLNINVSGGGGPAGAGGAPSP